MLKEIAIKVSFRKGFDTEKAATWHARATATGGSGTVTRNKARVHSYGSQGTCRATPTLVGLSAALWKARASCDLRTVRFSSFDLLYGYSTVQQCDSTRAQLT